jgi:acetate kinase
MATDAALKIFTVNTGSSSLKSALYEMSPAAAARSPDHAKTGRETLQLSGRIERIGGTGTHLRLEDAHGTVLLEKTEGLPDHGAALQAVLAWLKRQGREWQPDAVGHRLVHGGLHHRSPERITPELIAAIERLVPIVPDHLPQALQAIQVAGQMYPDLPQVGCFDTCFHSRMPRLAQILPLPRRLADEGVVRYGFHGLSYEYILEALRRIAPREAEARVIIAHLGNGSSMAAVQDGVGIDTTMGFTPSGGLMMGTRPGDLDPGVLLYLSAEKRMSPAALNDLINKESGLLGVSGGSADMRDLLARESSDARAAEAVGLYCYRAKKHLAALTAALGGLNSLVFTGGIGEHAAPVRMRICDGLEFLGIQLDSQRNSRHAAVISREGSSVTVRVIPTEEDRMIARHTAELIAA